MIVLGAVAATSAVAADWSADSVSYRYYSAHSDPGVSDNVANTVLRFHHVSGDTLGITLFTIT